MTLNTRQIRSKAKKKRIGIGTQQLPRDGRRVGISIVGLGYVGLSTAVCFAERGFKVTGIEVDDRKRGLIGSGRPPLHEKGLQPLLTRAVKNGNLVATPDYSRILSTGVTYVTVGTPSTGGGRIDLSYVEGVVKSLAPHLKRKEGYHVVVVKSTVIPGTTERKIIPLLESETGKRVRGGGDIGVAVNPEFLREGSAVWDTMNPDALVIGSTDEKAANFLMRIYRGFYRKMPETILTTPSNAEAIKYSVNISRAIQVSMVNSFADICARIPGGDVAGVAKALGVIARMDRRYLGAGLGFGGSCFGKDTRALIALADDLSIPSDLFRAALSVNAAQPLQAIALAKGILGTLNGRDVAVLGLSFKPGTDDVRESVAIELVKALVKEGCGVSVYDPVAMDNARTQLGETVSYAPTLKDCLRGKDCCFLATEWEEFKKEVRPESLISLMKTPIVIDGRRALPERMSQVGSIKFARIGTAQEGDRSPGSP